MAPSSVKEQANPICTCKSAIAKALKDARGVCKTFIVARVMSFRKFHLFIIKHQHPSLTPINYKHTRKKKLIMWSKNQRLIYLRALKGVLQLIRGLRMKKKSSNCQVQKSYLRN